MAMAIWEKKECHDMREKKERERERGKEEREREKESSVQYNFPS